MRPAAAHRPACPNITVQIVGEPDVLVEQVDVDRHKGWQQWAKCVLVCLVSFFGTAFTIMAYHNDVLPRFSAEPKKTIPSLSPLARRWR